MPSTEGVPARRAALQMLDAVLRRGRTLDSAAQAVKDLKPADLGLSVAIAGEVLRRMPNLDELIDSATRQRLPDDSKARMVLRIALAQKAGSWRARDPAAQGRSADGRSKSPGGSRAAMGGGLGR